MYEVRVVSDFSAAHFLKDYNGKCEALHGHNYRVYAYVRGAKLDAGGMLIDFAALKSALRNVCGALDHTNLNDMEVFTQNPSAERIARYIFDALTDALPSLKKNAGGSQYLYRVDVFETDSNRASYTTD